MPAPVVSWYNAANTASVSLYDLGQVDAGSTSTDTTFLIWNNRGGNSSLSDMTSTTITTKDSTGNNTGDLVTNTWIKARIPSDAAGVFAAIGGTTTKSVKSDGGSTAGVISGASNDGNTVTTATQNNFCTVTLRAVVPSTATAGNIDFLTRVSYQYT